MSTDFKLSRTMLRFRGRDVIVVTIDGQRQGFYRSSGRNSGMPGAWLPFDGLDLAGWFDKQAYVHHPLVRGVPESLHRFGTKRLKAASEWLATRRGLIRDGEEADAWRVNRFLRTPRSLAHARNMKRLERMLAA